MSLSWTGITKNKILTDSDINRAVEDGFLTSKTTIPTLDKGVTKKRALEYININPLHVSYSGKSDEQQLITKEDIKKPCDECTSYNIIINQSDLNDISGNTDNKIYLYYYPCGTYSGVTPYVTFSYPGTFTDYICAQSVKEACSDLVVGDLPMSVNYNDVHTLKIHQLENKIKQLENKIESLYVIIMDRDNQK